MPRPRDLFHFSAHVTTNTKFVYFVSPIFSYYHLVVPRNSFFCCCCYLLHTLFSFFVSQTSPSTHHFITLSLPSFSSFVPVTTNQLIRLTFIDFAHPHFHPSENLIFNSSFDKHLATRVDNCRGFMRNLSSI